MTPENSFQDPALEQALSEIRDEAIDPAVVEAAANRVWARLAEAAGQLSGEPIRGCAGFQALLADYRAGRLAQGRAMLVEDHLHACVACRHVYEGKVVTMPAARPAARPARRSSYTVLWVAAAVVVIAAGTGVWTVIERSGAPGGRARVEAVSGALYQVLADGTLHPLAKGQDLPEGVELRSAKDSDALLRLADGSQVELRERSSLFTTASANDLTIRLGRGSVMVEAAKRRKGHLFVDTGDCRVAVTGTIFGVSAGMKGSRVSVVQGEVHVEQGTGEKVLRRGDQTVTGVGMDPEPVKDDIAWSRNHDRYYALLADLRASLERIHLPGLRYQSDLLSRLPASTVLYVSYPNLGEYFSQAQAVLNGKIAESPELAPFWKERGAQVQPVIENLRADSSYLGSEIDMVALAAADGKPPAPVFVSELKREGFAEFVAQRGLPLTVKVRNGLVVFGPDRAAVESLVPVFDSPAGGFEGTPFYARIAQVYREGAGLLICVDLSRLAPREDTAGMRYFVAEEREISQQMEARATLSFDPAHSRISAWLADPAPMGSLDYVSPEAGTVAAFVVRDPAVIADLLAGVVRTTAAGLGAQGDLRNDLAYSLGGEFAVSLDGPIMPVPSWKLVVEVYDPPRLQSVFTRLVAEANRRAAKSGGHSIHMAQETVDGRTYYTIDSPALGPLAAAHYTFADGYMIAAPSRALVKRALDLKAAGTSITHAEKFMALTPRDHYANFSAVLYQNLGTSLAPLAGLLSGMTGAHLPPGQPNPIDRLGNLKPTLIAAYGAPDRITVAGAGDLLGARLESLLTDRGGWAAGSLPLGQLFGTGGRKPAYKEK
jgi:ferric-dicitrate binding protein FerR (iron transport regulator)